MNYYSTNRKSPIVDFKEAVIKSLPDDNGLYFPETIPDLSFLNQLENPTLPQLGFEILKPFCEGSIPENELEKIVTEALNFEIPLKEIEKNIFSLELFHGPTYAFKDVGARILARCLGYFNKDSDQEVTILVATSGDTGGAVASGFYGVEGVKVVILYPSGKVSELQEKQLTSLGGNITALEIDGTFDDCQALVKQAFLDQELTSKMNLSSANSINIARWIPQSIYYFWACAQLASEQELCISIPSGNYGNLAAGLLAKKMGAPIKRFIASSNVNDAVPRYLSSGLYEARNTIATYSNAMDVGAPSNFPRMLELYNGDYSSITKDISAAVLNDNQTLATMKACWEKNEYMLDPHGAIAYQILKDQLQENETGIFIETAHPCKFLPVISKVIPEYTVPSFASSLLSKKKESISMGKSYDDFKGYLVG
jgi:threonine synthase